MKTKRANRLYNYFAVAKANGKILTGWDYLKKDNYNHENLMSDKDHYFFDDLLDSESQYLFTDTEEELSERASKKLVKLNVVIRTKAQLIKEGIDPYDFTNWHKRGDKVTA